MDEEEVEVETGGLGGIDFGRLRTDPAAVLGDVYKQQMAAQRAEEIAAKDRYEAARARIEARNQGPSTSEQLFAISQALLAPRKYRGIAGTIGKLSGAFGDISEAQRKATMSREDQLAQLQEAYMGETAKFGTRRAQTAADLVRTGAPLLKTPARSTTSKVMLGPDFVLRSRTTGAQLKEPPLEEIYAFQAYMSNPANTPENKAITAKNFDKAYGFGSADIYLEEQ
jgi:hypothetical protein